MNLFLKQKIGVFLGEQGSSLSNFTDPEGKNCILSCWRARTRRETAGKVEKITPLWASGTQRPRTHEGEPETRKEPASHSDTGCVAGRMFALEEL